MLLVKQAPRSPWDAVLTQLVLWSFRRFCANRIITGDDTLWEDHISLLTEFAPPQFKPHLDEWIEHLQSIPNLSDLDAKLRAIVADLEDEEKEDDLSLLLDVDLSKQIQAWLGKTFAPFSLFPGEDDSDDSIDQTKLNSIVFLLKINRSIRRKTHRIHRLFAEKKKTRRNQEARKGDHSANAVATAVQEEQTVQAVQAVQAVQTVQAVTSAEQTDMGKTNEKEEGSQASL